MAMIDSKNRLYIEKETAERFGYLPGEKIAFVRVDEKTYRLADPTDIILGESRVVCKDVIIDDRCRFEVPKTLRKMYTNEAVLEEKEGCLYLHFMRFKEDAIWVKKQLFAIEMDDRK